MSDHENILFSFHLWGMVDEKSITNKIAITQNQFRELLDALQRYNTFTSRSLCYQLQNAEAKFYDAYQKAQTELLQKIELIDKEG